MKTENEIPWYDGPKDLGSILEEQARLEALLIKARTAQKHEQAETIRRELDAINEQLRAFYKDTKAEPK
jgi:hypothetical protein